MATRDVIVTVGKVAKMRQGGSSNPEKSGPCAPVVLHSPTSFLSFLALSFGQLEAELSLFFAAVFFFWCLILLFPLRSGLVKLSLALEFLSSTARTTSLCLLEVKNCFKTANTAFKMGKLIWHEHARFVSITATICE
jgi:hypothetical protein